MDLLDRLLESDRWLTEQLLATCAPLTDAQLDQEFDIGHRTLRATLDHLIFNVGAWAASMEGTSVEVARGGDSLAELQQRYALAADQFAATARRVQTEGRLDEAFIDGWHNPQTQGSTILHITLHNHLHRSEMIHMLDRLGFPGLDQLDPQAWEHSTSRALSG